MKSDQPGYLCFIEAKERFFGDKVKLRTSDMMNISSTIGPLKARKIPQKLCYLRDTLTRCRQGPLEAAEPGRVRGGDEAVRDPPQ